MSPFPRLPEGCSARSLTPDDVDAVAALLAEAEKVDDTGEFLDADDLTEWWVNDLVDLPRDGLAVCRDGAVVGYATAVAPPTFRDAFAVYLEGRVHPAHRGRGIGSALLDWQLRRGAEVHAEQHPEAPARLTVTVAETMPALAELARRAGLTAHRVYRQMERPLTELPEPAADGVVLVPFDWALDDEVRRAHNGAFTDHYGSSERDVASWQHMFTGQRSFRADLSTLALADGAVVAYALVYVYESDTRATGIREAHFGQIGTLPTFRGRGLGSAVIATSLRAAAASDCQTAGLQVDSENSSGAVGLYERLGFRTRRIRVSWSRPVPPLVTGKRQVAPQ